MEFIKELLEPDNSSIKTYEADILKNSRRRGVIRALSEDTFSLQKIVDSLLGKQESGIKKEDVIYQLAKWETNSDPNNLSRNKIKSFNATLLQSHIPKLKEANLLHYEEDTRYFYPDKDKVEHYLQFIEEKPRKESAFHKVNSNEKTHYLRMDEGFEILSNERRQLAINYMDDVIQTELAELADFVARNENGYHADERPSSAERKRVYITLLQSHLPKLHSYNILEYDDNRKEIKKDEYFEHISQFVPENTEEIE